MASTTFIDKHKTEDSTSYKHNAIYNGYLLILLIHLCG